MAGGIDWFRWHHGSVTDPKFQLVARKSGASLPDVLAVWAYLLECASAAEFRGCFGEVDCDAIDCLFGFDEGTTNAIMAQMVERKLIADEYIVAWGKRQPKRERESDNSTERSRAFREKQRQSRHCNTETEDATPCNATQRQKKPRGEESREEVNPIPDAYASSSAAPTESGGQNPSPLFARFWELWPGSPRKVAKTKCAEKWRRLRLDATADRIIDHVVAMKGSEQWRSGFDPSPMTYLSQRRWEDGVPDADAYSDDELRVFAAYRSATDGAGWPEAVVEPFSPDRARLIREFLGFSAKPDWVPAYFGWLAGNLPAKPGYGFDWAIKRETYLRAKEGNFAVLQEATA